MKKCTVCKEEKPLTEYYNYKASKDGKAYRCKACDNLARKKWRTDNPERSARSARNRRLKYVYGVDIEWYKTKLQEQNGQCAICGVTENNTTGERTEWNFAVDHNHDTGEVRGLLCNTCNRALGMFNDSEEILNKAKQYLAKY